MSVPLIGQSVIDSIPAHPQYGGRKLNRDRILSNIAAVNRGERLAPPTTRQETAERFYLSMKAGF